LEEKIMKNLLCGKTPFLLLCAAATAFVLYWHWRHALDALPFLIVLACPLAHIFMHHGHGHGHDHGAHGKDAMSAIEPRPDAKGE
jgi:Protein of unknown function (DUF2933)